MLRSTTDLRGYVIRATDGDLGSVDQFLFEDQRWTVRYLVAGTGSWLAERLVLISPIAVRGIDQQTEALQVSLTREQVENSPDISTDAPVSRQYEEEYFRYYGYTPYWLGPDLWGAGMLPGSLVHPAATPLPQALAAGQAGQAGQAGAQEQEQAPRGDQHLRSTYDLINYQIQASDGEVGAVNDFIIDDESWTIRYMVVDTGSWLPGKKVLIAPQWIEQIDWPSASVSVGLTRAAVKQSPEYDRTALDREYEERLHRHYGRPAYWER